MLACHLLNTLVKKVFTMYQWSKYIAPSTILLEMFFGTICCFLKVFFFELRTKRSFGFRSRSCSSFAILLVVSQNIGQHSCTICECLPCSSDRQMPSSFGEWWELDKGGLTHFLLRKFNVGNSKILWKFVKVPPDHSQVWGVLGGLYRGMLSEFPWGNF